MSETITVSEDRIEYIDVYRAIGIILMVLGHMEFSGEFYHYIHAFHMPMFFFIAGFCYKKKNIDLKTFAIKKASSLLIPYVVFGVSQYLFWLLIKGHSVEPLKHLFWINTDGLAIAGAIWFLTALFVADIIFFLLDNSVQNRLFLTVIITVLSIIGNLLPTIWQIRLPFGIDSALVGLGFYYVGNILHTYKDNVCIHYALNLKGWMVLILIFVDSILIKCNGTTNMRTGQYSNIFLFWINAIVMSILLISISKLLCNVLAIIIITLLKMIGRQGIVYVCLNQFIITVIQELLSKLNISGKIYALTLIVFSFVVLVFVAQFIFNSKLCILVGKKVNNY